MPEEMFDDWLPEWRRVTWTGRGEFGLNPWNAPGRVVRLHVEDCSEELLRQQSYVIKNQLGHPKPPTRGFGTQNTQRQYQIPIEVDQSVSEIMVVVVVLRPPILILYVKTHI